MYNLCCSPQNEGSHGSRASEAIRSRIIQAALREFAEAWGGYVSAYNPEPNRMFDIQNEANLLNVADRESTNQTQHCVWLVLRPRCWVLR
ncbi:hypothetical protein CSOJ01_09921 [Colletotrichum sojae]|uniref:Uncharacterized protein n=1 Tax=Colletotrichum sojae TaxID=2175907 RepID=A0A8H6MPZ0_9PEZI|nr:hypothetical protein CSOJ01_09921 [Colletotrichum sojae]